MNAEQLKVAVGRWTLLAQPRSICATEFYNADLWVVNGLGYSTEFEIKINRADLNSELKIIKAITEEWPIDDRNKFSWNKHRKHQNMLSKFKPSSSSLIDSPNRFFFAVPPDLVYLAMEGCKYTKYGVISVDLKKKYDHVEVIKKAGRIHSEKAGDYHLKSLARRVSLERFFRKNEDLQIKIS